MVNLKSVIIRCLIFYCVILINTGLSGQIETGKIVDKIMCADNQHSYSLFLPSTYSKAKKWPVIFFLDAAKRWALPLERFKDAAEKYGYILVCSRQFQDGPYDANNRAMLAMWNDVHQRFPVDPNRRYGSGFSGGARGATRLHYMTQKSLAGIIACGAGLDVRLKPEHIDTLYFIATISFRDFNYKEMMKLESQLAAKKVRYSYLLFNGYHRWPDAADCARTVEWLEIDAMKKKTRPVDQVLLDLLYQKELQMAVNLEKENRLFAAVRGYELCIRLFKPLRQVSDAETGYRRIMEQKAYKNFLKKENKRNREEWEYIARFARAAREMKTEKVTRRSFSKYQKYMGLSYLRNKADQKKNNYDAAWAERLLIEVIMKFSRAGDFFLKQKDYKRAALFLELAFVGTESNYGIPFELARTYSMDGEKKKALKYLEISIDRGYKDKKSIENDNALIPLRREKKYSELLKRLR